jgi:negative regulator of flagellin synthesis FlgM
MGQEALLLSSTFTHGEQNRRGRLESGMKLTGIFSQIKTDKVQVKKSEEASAAKSDKSQVAPTDRVEISAGSMEVQKSKEILAQTPSVRADKVNALKEQIAKGEYQVDPYKVADKMMAGLASEIMND